MRAPGEHPRLPRLVCELTEARPEQTTARGKVIQAGRPTTARVLIDTTRVLVTAHPPRLRAWAAQLLELADVLELEHRRTAGLVMTEPSLFDEAAAG